MSQPAIAEREDEMSQAAIAELIERNIGELIQEWTKTVRMDPRIVSDSGLTTPELIDHVPAIVAEICALIRRSRTLTFRRREHHRSAACGQEARQHDEGTLDIFAPASRWLRCQLRPQGL